jgi:alkylation response protein AidB-like acyl-CoA dehydrogenase
MDFRLTAEMESFKKDFLDWLDKNLEQKFLSIDYDPPTSWEERTGLYRDFQRKLYDAKYAGITYPEKYGGRGGGLTELIIVTEALAPWIINVGNINGIGHGMAGPTILACGTEDQKCEFLPKLLSGEHIWCQGFSEPNSGSDVASVATRAIRDGDDYIISGQKVWITSAHVADYCILLVRTDPECPKHRGLSYFLVDMGISGVEVHPLVQITGEAEFNEVFFNEVRIPSKMLVGKEGQGWQIAMTTLMYERVVGDISVTSGLCWLYEGIVKMAKGIMLNGNAATKDPIIRQKLAQTFIELMVLRYTGYRSVSRLEAGNVPGPEGSIGKLFWSELYQRMTELAMEIQGQYHQLIKGSPAAFNHGRWQYLYLISRGFTIGGGTSEIQRNIIGERVLGLPRDSAA